MFKKYKREIVLCAVIIFVCIIVAAAIAYFASNTIVEAESEYYALTTCVVEIDRDNDIVTYEDSNGNLWEFYGCEDWQEGDCASLLMNTCGTASIYDDTICGATYGTWALTR